MLTVFAMITELTIAGFMGIPPESEETPAQTLKLGRFNVLVGANGAGKTTILRALSYLSELLHRHSLTLEQSRWFLHKRFYENLPKPLKFILGYNFQWTQGNKINCGNVTLNEIITQEIKNNVHLITGKATYTPDDEFTVDQKFIQEGIFLGHYFKTKLYSLDPRSIRTPLPLSTEHKLNHQDEIIISCLENGSGTIEALAEILLTDPMKMNTIQNAVQEIIPNFERIRFSRSSPSKPRQMLIDTKHSKGIPADVVSEGTLLVIGLMTILHSNQSPTLLLLDNLDQGLHPTAQGDLVQNLRKILELRPDLQIVATTQSPYLVDYCAADEVIVAAYDQDKGTPVYKKMIEHPEYEAAKDVLKLGEFWSFAGEQWVTGKDTKSITEE